MTKYEEHTITQTMGNGHDILYLRCTCGWSAAFNIAAVKAASPKPTAVYDHIQELIKEHHINVAGNTEQHQDSKAGQQTSGEAGVASTQVGEAVKTRGD